MELFKAFGTDAALEEKGQWIDFGEGTQFKLAYAGTSNQRYFERLTALQEQYAVQLKTKTLGTDVSKSEMLKLFADLILLDWKGVKDKDGSDLEYSKDNVLYLMGALPHLYDALQEEATAIAHFKQQVDEEDTKNS